MKTKNIFLSLLVLFVIASCKNSTEKKGSDENNAELKETFDVSFNLTIPKDDTFQLYYTQDGTLNFSDDKSVKSVVKGNATAQDVLFKLPADVLPTQIRLDFGDNPEQGNIVVKNMKIKYLSKNFDVNFDAKNLLTHYFYLLDTQVKYDEATSSIIMLKPEGQRYDPQMWSNQFLSDQMGKLYKNN